MQLILAFALLFAAAYAGEVADIVTAYEKQYYPCSCKMFTNDPVRSSTICEVRESRERSAVDERAVIERATPEECQNDIKDARNPDPKNCYQDPAKLTLHAECQGLKIEAKWKETGKSAEQYRERLNSIVKQLSDCYKKAGGTEECFRNPPTF